MHSALSAYSANWSEIYYNSYLSPQRRRCKKFVVSLQLCMFSKFNIKGTSRGFANIKSKRNMSTSTRNVLQYIYIGLISQNGHFHVNIRRWPLYFSQGGWIDYPACVFKHSEQLLNISYQQCTRISWHAVPFQEAGGRQKTSSIYGWCL